MQHGNITHHLFLFFFTTHIQHKNVYIAQEILHIIQHTYNTHTLIQCVYTTRKSKIKWEKHFQFYLRLLQQNFDFQKGGK